MYLDCIEIELFGVEGDFEKIGVLECVDKGILLLDEVVDMFFEM